NKENTWDIYRRKTNASRAARTPQASEKARRNAAIDEYRTYMAEPKNVSELAKWAHDHPAMISEVEKAARRRVSEKGEDTGAEEDDDEEAPDAHLRIITMEDRYSAMEELSGLILSLAFDQVRNYNLRLDINGLIELFVDRFKTNVEKGVLAVTATGKLRGYLESCHRLPTKEAADMLRYSQGQIAQQSMNQTAETLNNRCDMVSGSGAQIPYPPTAAADDPTPVRHAAPVRITKRRSGNTRKGRSGTEIPVIEPLSESRDDQMLNLDGIKKTGLRGLNPVMIKAALHQATNGSIKLEGDLAYGRPMLTTLAEQGLQLVNWPGPSPHGPCDYPGGNGTRPCNWTSDLCKAFIRQVFHADPNLRFSVICCASARPDERFRICSTRDRTESFVTDGVEPPNIPKLEAKLQSCIEACITECDSRTMPTPAIATSPFYSHDNEWESTELGAGPEISPALMPSATGIEKALKTPKLPADFSLNFNFMADVTPASALVAPAAPGTPIPVIQRPLFDDPAREHHRRSHTLEEDEESDMGHQEPDSPSLRAGRAVKRKRLDAFSKRVQAPGERPLDRALTRNEEGSLADRGIRVGPNFSRFDKPENLQLKAAERLAAAEAKAAAKAKAKAKAEPWAQA
ncbi:hypothetical protein FRB96_007785, partial [Tulasnella sp. 330]